MPEVKAGQVWYDAIGDGFVHVRSVESVVEPRAATTRRLAVVSEPAEFWNDAKTKRSVRRVALVLMEPAHGWHGPYDVPSKCPMAKYYPSLGMWAKRGMVL